MNVEELMNRKVHTCQPENSLNVPARLMWEWDVGCIPVVDADDRPVGIITDRDICMSSYFTGKPLEQQAVSHAMAKKVHAARMGQSIRGAEELMRTKQIRRLPVVDDAGKLVGILSLNDLALAAGPKRAVQPDELTATLASICQPRRSPASAAA